MCIIAWNIFYNECNFRMLHSFVSCSIHEQNSSKLYQFIPIFVHQASCNIRPHIYINTAATIWFIFWCVCFLFSHQVCYFTCRIQSIDVSCINKLHQDWCPNVRYLGKIVFNFSIHLVMDDARETVKNLAAGTEVIICKSDSGLFVITPKVWLHTYPCTSLFHLWVTARVCIAAIVRDTQPLCTTMT